MEQAFAVAQNGVHNAVFTQSIIANNLSNMSTPAFKANRSEAGTFRVPGAQIMNAVAYHEQGPLRQTGRELDISIAGEGFFVLQTDSGRAFTRAGIFHKDEDGNLVGPGGYLLEANLEYPRGATTLQVRTDGLAIAGFPDGESEVIGRLELARFRNPAGLIDVGDNVYLEGPNSGDAIVLEPGDEGAGLLKQGFVERSNVDEATEITNQLVNQRHFQASLKTFQIMNELVGTAIDLKR